MKRLLMVTIIVGLFGMIPRASAQESYSVNLSPIAVATRHLEEGWFKGPCGVGFDRKTQEMWVADTGNSLLGVFTPDGVPLYATNAGGTILEPVKVIVDADGSLWVLDNNRARIARLDWRGKPLPSPVLVGLPDKPSIGTIALDSQGWLYVGENTQGTIHVYDRQLKPKFEFGSRGDEDEQFIAITGIAVGVEVIAVVDAIGRPVQLFNRRGEFIMSWGEHDMHQTGFSLPQAVAIDSKQRIIVVDELRHDLKVYDLTGNFLGRFGGLGNGPGALAYPIDIAVDGSDHLYVAEKSNNRVQVFAFD